MGNRKAIQSIVINDLKIEITYDPKHQISMELKEIDRLFPEDRFHVEGYINSIKIKRRGYLEFSSRSLKFALAELTTNYLKESLNNEILSDESENKSIAHYIFILLNHYNVKLDIKIVYEHGSDFVDGMVQSFKSLLHDVTNESIDIRKYEVLPKVLLTHFAHLQDNHRLNQIKKLNEQVIALSAECKSLGNGLAHKIKLEETVFKDTRDVKAIQIQSFFRGNIMRKHISQIKESIHEFMQSKQNIYARLLQDRLSVVDLKGALEIIKQKSAIDTALSAYEKNGETRAAQKIKSALQGNHATDLISIRQNLANAYAIFEGFVEENVQVSSLKI